MKWIFAILMVISLKVSAETVSASVTELAAPTIAVNAAAGDSAEIAAAALTATPTAAVATATKPASAPSLKSLKESEIPVILEATKKSGANDSPIFKLILSLSVVGVLGCAAYFFLRKYAKKGPKNQATQIKVLSQHFLGPKKSLAIIRVAGESILIGVTDHNVTLIKSLSLLDEDIPEETPINFGKVFGKTHRQIESASTADDKDEFSITGIKDFVSSKLKTMRSIE